MTQLPAGMTECFFCGTTNRLLFIGSNGLCMSVCRTHKKAGRALLNRSVENKDRLVKTALMKEGK